MRPSLIVVCVMLLAPGLLPATAAAQETCVIRPVRTEAPPSAEALNEALACIQRRMERLEQQSGRSSSGGAPTGPGGPSPSPAQAFEFNDLRISVEHASVVKRQ